MRSRGHDFYITEHVHAYLVRGPDIMWGPTVDQARLALFEWLGRKKWTRICAMPYRPMWTGSIGEEVPTGSIVFYFDISQCDCHEHRREYKP